MKTKNILKRTQERATYLLNSSKRISIRKKIFIFVGLFILLNIIINLIVVKVSINDIYISFEKRELKKEYSLIKEAYDDENKLIDLLYNANNNGIKIKILDSNYNVIYTIFNDKMSSMFTNLDLMMLSELGPNQSKIITLKNYERSGYDLHLVGRIDNNYVILSASIKSIKKDAKTTTIILIITSVFTLIILTIISYFISKIFSKKINEIKEVTEDISNLKFDKKIEVNTNDELGDLFDNVNKMSIKLEESINKLEDANVKLKNDLMEKEKQEEARKKLIANISHEFKTPLTIISGYSQLMLEDVKGPENKKNMKLIISESERLSDLVHEFLELSRLESGNINLNKVDVNVKELIDNELDKLGMKIKEKKIKVETKFIGNQIIKADKKQFAKVIENILTNAIKFVKNDNVIKIKTYNKDNYFYYEVYNSGDNIKDSDLENIFNSYYKDKSTRNTEGTGLGLTIVKAIVDLHNGICTVKNVKDGVKFIISIPKK